MALLKNGLQWHNAATKFNNNHPDGLNFETARRRQSTFSDPISTVLCVWNTSFFAGPNGRGSKV